jgi:hypothetical protein
VLYINEISYLHYYSRQDNKGGGTPQRTPQRTPNRNATTPNRMTPIRISCQSRSLFKTPVRAPDFVSLARQHQHQHESTSGGHNSFFAYNPEKEPIKVYLHER